MAGPAAHRLLSIVVPVYCEEEIVNTFHARTTAAMQRLPVGLDYELIYVNDGSTDRSLELLLQLQRGDAHVRILDFSRNFGHQAAITAGLDAAQGDAVVIIDGDLQDPPEVIPQMVACWAEGYQVVYGKRRVRRGDGLIKRLLAHGFYRVIRWLSDVDIPADVGDFRLLDRQVADVLRGMREENRYLRGMVAWAGFTQRALEYDRDPRYAGEPKYTFGRSLRLALDAITSFTDKPLRLLMYGGTLIALLAFGYLIWTVVARLLHPEAAVSGWASLIVVLTFFGGLQLAAIGVVGLYLGRVFREVKGRPLYVLRARYGPGVDGAKARLQLAQREETDEEIIASVARTMQPDSRLEAAP